MSLDHLLAGLERDAAAQAEGVLAAARAEAARITAAADEAAAQRQATAVGVRETELRGIAETALAAVRLAGRAQVLERRRQLLDGVFAAAREEFAAVLDDADYRAALPGHVSEALNALGLDCAATVVCGPAIADTVTQAVGGREQIVVRAEPAAAPGIRVTSADGVIEVDNTLNGRLERLRPRLELELLGRIAAQ